MEFMDDIMFIGMDMPKAVKKLLDEADEMICKNMTPDEKKVYDFGVKTTLQALKDLISAQDDNEVYVHIPGVADYGEEFDYADLKKIILK